MRKAWNKGSMLISKEQQAWLRENFANEDNFILADTLGISESTMHRYARAFGLKKSKAYMKRCQRETTDAAHYFNRINGNNERLRERMKNGGMSEKFIACRISAENNLWKRCPEKMRKASALGGQSLHLTWEEEKQRVRMGLPQRTRLKIGEGLTREENKRKASRRFYLKTRGYILDGLTAYWTADTRRCPRLEKDDRIFTYKYEKQL